MNYNLFQLINQLAGYWDGIDDVMEIFAQDIVWIMLTILAVLWFSGKEQNQKATFYACLSAGTALMIGAFIISPAVNHPRPFVGHMVHQLIPHVADPSFPSDHSTLAFALAFNVMLYNRKLGKLMFLLAVLTGFARVYVGVHYPADILGGCVLSSIVSIVIFLVRQHIEPLRRFCTRLSGTITVTIQKLVSNLLSTFRA
ncbi:undecaprenyl-diphosphatase [Paenibacillus albus]|uniref:Undecaprenyl-diphosphatase n=1 Tax=Paenibacillus albus TaxID=2495582 RepID=A0A3S9AAA5_9BACL|nr:undecaprenyl-diphosphatase [Paenibacillus albus]AZN42682.1 undecaprenyl-diphosphatase [Paenibacillus albus]